MKITGDLSARLRNLSHNMGTNSGLHKFSRNLEHHVINIMTRYLIPISQLLIEVLISICY